MLYWSPRLTADEAQNIGLLDRVLPDDTFREDALNYAIELANGPTETLAKIKVNIHEGLQQSLEDSFALEAKHTIESFECSEAREAISAFQQKRKPVFHGNDNA